MIRSLKEYKEEKPKFKKEFLNSKKEFNDILNKHEESHLIHLLLYLHEIGILSEIELNWAILLAPSFLPLNLKVKSKIITKSFNKLPLVENEHEFEKLMDLFRKEALNEIRIQRKKKIWLKPRFNFINLEKYFKKLKPIKEEKITTHRNPNCAVVHESLKDIWYAFTWCYQAIRIQREQTNQSVIKFPEQK